MTRKISICLHEPLKLFREQLIRKTINQKKFRYIIWIDGSLNQFKQMLFYGIIKDSEFKLVKVIAGKNFFTPVLSGALLEKDMKTFVEINIKNSPFMRLSIIFFLGMICSLTLAFVTTLEFVCLYILAISIIIFTSFLLLNRCFYRKTARNIQNEITMLMSEDKGTVL